MLTRRPVATRRWLPSMVSSRSPSCTTTCTFGPAASTRTTVTPLRTCDAFARQLDRVRSRAHSGSSRASGSRRLQHGDLGAEPAEGLRELKPDRTRADDHEMRWARGEIEHSLVGEMRRRVEPGNRRHRRRGAGGDDEAPCLDLDLLADDHRVGVLETGRALDHPHAKAGKALLGVVWRDGGDDVVHVLVDAGEINLRPTARARRSCAPRRRRGHACRPRSAISMARSRY